MIVLIEGGIADIERLDTEPVDPAEIAQLWKVYTTTKRRLLDPTAERLENYWWRIWGSRKRQLNGATVARLFAHISDNQTFVPLRGPENRDEGTSPLESNTRFATGVSSVTTLPLPGPSTRGPATNSSRTPVVMPHPILKKSRGPSTTGPRPTARFISPHESENEAEVDSSGGLNSNVVVQPPSPGGEAIAKLEKKPISSGRKKSAFVATSANKKKRPVIVRRQNSQSSADSIKASDSSKGSGSAGSAQSPLGRSPPMSPELFQPSQGKGKQVASSRFHEQFTPVCRIAAPHSSPREKAGSRRIQSKGDPSRKPSRKPETTKPPGIQSGVLASRASDKQGSANNIQSPRRSSQPESTKSRRESSEKKKATLQEVNTTLQPEVFSEHRRASREKKMSVDDTTEQNTEQNRNSSTEHSHISQIRRSKSGGELSNDGMEIMHHHRKSAAILAPTLTPATGQLALGDATTDSPPAPPRKESRVTTKDKGKGRADDAPPRDVLFAKKPVKTTGTPAVSEAQGSLARSKSQLTLLLEKDQKDRAKNAEHMPNGKRH